MLPNFARLVSDSSNMEQLSQVSGVPNSQGREDIVTGNVQEETFRAMNGAGHNAQTNDVQAGGHINTGDPQFIVYDGVTFRWDEFKQGYDPITLTAPARMQHQTGDFQGPFQLGGETTGMNFLQSPPRHDPVENAWGIANQEGSDGNSQPFQFGSAQGNGQGANPSHPMDSPQHHQQSQRSPNGIGKVVFPHNLTARQHQGLINATQKGAHEVNNGGGLSSQSAGGTQKAWSQPNPNILRSRNQTRKGWSEDDGDPYLRNVNPLWGQDVTDDELFAAYKEFRKYEVQTEGKPIRTIDVDPWKAKMQIRAMSKKHFLIILKSEEEKHVVLTGPPLYMYKRMVFVSEWSHDFNHTKIYQNKLPIWVNLPHVHP
ncbi:hypothetical protein R1sor_016004 [Riccia sorocarpa]|uniref:DUF4283 domain-containing protein n=1 Tax=Riccia sorocarpa TaxID=122646 RepID=A0ABD3HH81_9MARC